MAVQLGAGSEEGSWSGEGERHTRIPTQIPNGRSANELNHMAAQATSFIQPVAPQSAPSVPPDVPESTEQTAQQASAAPGLQ